MSNRLSTERTVTYALLAGMCWDIPAAAREWRISTRTLGHYRAGTARMKETLEHFYVRKLKERATDMSSGEWRTSSNKARVVDGATGALVLRELRRLRPEAFQRQYRLMDVAAAVVEFLEEAGGESPAYAVLDHLLEQDVNRQTVYNAIKRDKRIVIGDGQWRIAKKR